MHFLSLIGMFTIACSTFLWSDSLYTSDIFGRLNLFNSYLKSSYIFLLDWDLENKVTIQAYLSYFSHKTLKQVYFLFWIIVLLKQKAFPPYCFISFKLSNLYMSSFVRLLTIRCKSTLPSIKILLHAFTF